MKYVLDRETRKLKVRVEALYKFMFRILQRCCQVMPRCGVNEFASLKCQHLSNLRISQVSERNCCSLWSEKVQKLLKCHPKALLKNVVFYTTKPADYGSSYNTDYSDGNKLDKSSTYRESSLENRIENEEGNTPVDLEAGSSPVDVEEGDSLVDLGAGGSPVDVEAELLRYDYEEFELGDAQVAAEPKRKTKKPVPFPLTRGKSGVFDVDEICALLRNDNARDLCAIRVPPELKYIDYLVVATGRSTRHLRAMAEYIQWMYKQKRDHHDPAAVKLEGEHTQDWFAMDLGNIAVHLMLESTRAMYDIEQLWAVGPEFDEQTRLGSLTGIGKAASIEQFSFDSELEKFRKLREQEDRQVNTNVDSKRRKKNKISSTETLPMENVTGWHSVN